MKKQGAGNFMFFWIPSELLLEKRATFWHINLIFFEGKQRETCKCVLNNRYEQQGMKLPKYNLILVVETCLFCDS